MDLVDPTVRMRFELFVPALLIASACSLTGGGTAEPVEGLPSGPSALDDRTNPAFPEPLIDPDAIQRVLGPDQIPAIDAPSFVSVVQADAYLVDQEPVVTLEIDGDARAYPVGILMFHEIVNDRVGDVPVSVTYCPLCNSAVSYRRSIDGVETTFGTSGTLFNSALVMYDRASQTLWTHFDGRAVVGILAGTQLEVIPSPLLSWSDFKLQFPNGQVLSREGTRQRGDISQNAYAGYDNVDTRTLFPHSGSDAAPAKLRVVGVTVGEEATAWTLDSLASGAASVTETQVGATEVAVFWTAGQASALDSSRISEGRQVGSVGVFLPEADGQVLSFEIDGDRIVDTETGSTWAVTGLAVGGTLAGAQLERVAHLDTFWFAWSAYRPDTALLGG